MDPDVDDCDELHHRLMGSPTQTVEVADGQAVTVQIVPQRME